MRNTIVVYGPSGKRIVKGRIVRATHALLSSLRIHKRSLDVFLLTTKDMLHLKQKAWLASHIRVRAKQLRRDLVVDVLSFPSPKGFFDPEHAHPSLGEVYLNHDILSRDPQRGVRLLVHGVLHLLGYDHVRDREAVRMERLEHTLWDRITSSD